MNRRRRGHDERAEADKTQRRDHLDPGLADRSDRVHMQHRRVGHERRFQSGRGPFETQRMSVWRTKPFTLEVQICTKVTYLHLTISRILSDPTSVETDSVELKTSIPLIKGGPVIAY